MLKPLLAYSCSVKHLEYFNLWKRNNEKQKQSSSDILEATFRIVQNALWEVKVMSKHFLIQRDAYNQGYCFIHKECVAVLPRAGTCLGTIVCWVCCLSQPTLGIRAVIIYISKFHSTQVWLLNSTERSLFYSNNRRINTEKQDCIMAVCLKSVLSGLER